MTFELRRLFHSCASHCEPVYEAIRESVGQSEWVMPDETGWRVGGHPARLHALVGPQAIAYVIDPTRSGAVAAVRHRPVVRRAGAFIAIAVPDPASSRRSGP